MNQDSDQLPHSKREHVFLQAIDFFLPKGEYKTFTEINHQRKCRIIVAGSILCGTIALTLPLVFRLLIGAFDSTDIIVIPAGFLLLSCPLILHKSGNARLASQIFLTCIIIVSGLPSLLVGGLVSTTVVFIILLPLAAVLLLGSRAGLTVTCGVIAALILLYLGREMMAKWQILSSEEYLLTFLICASLGTIVAFSFGWVFEKSQATATEQMTNILTQLEAAHQELVTARNDAEAANLAKSEFLATMSHEIRTPLNGVIGMTGLLLDTQQTKQQQEFTDIVRTSGESLLTIINDILDFSKIEAGKIELEETPFNLRVCIEEALDLVTVKATGKSIELLQDMPLTVPTAVVGDGTRLRQILLNLLSNAVKFTESGEIIVSVESKALQDGRHQFRFSVKDSGIGIPKDRLSRLFKSFSQVDASTTRKFGGTGLGLAISKRLSEIMGGTMWVESEVGKGSSFYFTINMASAPDTAIEHTAIQMSSIDGESVLIVDDNATNRIILTHQLKAWGLVPTAAESGEEALSLLSQGAFFSFTILDMQMPGMDGLMTAEQIRKNHPAASLPLILLTSIGNMAKGEYSRHQICASITKPVKASQLMEAIMLAVNTKVGHGDHQTASNGAKLADSTAQKERLPLRILLAEDNPVNQMVALKMLEQNGYRADVAANGLETIDALKRQNYDLIFMDVRMPEMDGIEATQYIRSKVVCAKQPIIVAMTAEALVGDRERLLAIGMDDYISKPVRPEELLRALGSAAEQVLAKSEPTIQ